MNLKANRRPSGQNPRLRTVVIITLALLAILTDHGSRADNEPTKLATSEKVLKEKPIVILTEVRGYDQPTLSEYTQCHENRDNCIRVCKSAGNRTACEQECPTCPILLSQDVVVQGVNDTDYRLPAASAPVNSTNIIRLTNEIHNIIENQMGNITTINENNISIHQNISDVGGQFGLGYNNNGSCCIVVRRSQNCDAQRGGAQTAAGCHHKRHRVCGERCKSGVMYAKLVSHCDDNGSSCQQRVEYVPYQRRRRTTGSSRQCQYTQQWPFVACHSQHRRVSANHCRECLQLPYGYILQHGISPRCVSCYGGPRGPPQESYMAPQYAPEWQAWPSSLYRPEFSYSPPSYYGGGNNIDWIPEDELTFPGGSVNDGGWKIEKTKCRGTDGAITENCHNIESGDGPSFPIDETVPLEHLPEAQEENYFYDDAQDAADNVYDEGFDVGGARRRRQTFHRSAYSRRNT